MMKERVCLVTGASSGIGKKTALGLARKGATVILLCRDRGRGEAALSEIKAESGNDRVALELCDLSSQRSIRAFAEGFEARHPALHVLVNNAGLIVGERTITEDGLELTFALNHLGYFLLTTLLLDLLKKSAPARIVNVASEAQSIGRIDFEDLGGERAYNPMRAYCQSKLANVVFTYELARRLEGTGVTANCLHPGAVGTNFGQTGTPFFRFLVRLGKPFLLSEEKGAETSIFLASDPEIEGVSGKYFAKKKAVRSSKVSYDLVAAARLWEVSGKLTGVST